MKITTKTGDRGETGLFGGRRVSKASSYMMLLGELDELQSFVGFARCSLDEPWNLEILNRVQDDIYRIMGIIGFEMKCPPSIREIQENDVEFLENLIEKNQKAVENLSEFIRPGTNESAARLQVTRAVCRRVERRVVLFNEKNEVKIPEVILRYLNRLSDLLFIMAYQLETL